ncbi:glycosyltransferase family 2 protein [Selenomonas ruminantium]|uniref:Glycosyltransferase involved in cell wall bisynthesis n=1 Tax=Selenomonas ruminantium TaxID=971 RepID=A0A1I0YGU2_SELRU|nr:glycosyltransferase family 2 protein [Selenomonas ruminantium]SFB12077.1 Glycosyltransferase involved in cell wall bisynthesis [Selenomonas ruminantium]
MIDVIVPVYNVEKTIERCIDSIIDQSYKEWNLYLVDDGSSDESLAICYRYGRKTGNLNGNITVIHQENQGPSSARNAGIKAGCGEYVCFVDADDWLEKTCLQNLVLEIEEADVCICNGYVWDDNGPYRCFYDKGDIPKLCCKDDMVDFLFSPYGFFVWGRLYKRKAIQTLFDVNVRYGEDILFNYQIVNGGNKLKIVEDVGYNYVINRNGLSLTLGKSDPTDMIYMITQIYSEQIENELFDIYTYAWGRYSLGRLLAFFINDTPLNDRILKSISFIKKNIFKIKSYDKWEDYQLKLLEIFAGTLENMGVECKKYYREMMEAVKRFSNKYIYIYIYGIGNKGYTVLRFLNGEGVNISGFLKTELKTRDNYVVIDNKVYNTYDLSSLRTSKESTGIILAMSNHNAIVCEKKLIDIGYNNIMKANFFDE